MRNTINMREVTDRVLGMVPPSTPFRTGRRRRNQRGFATALLAVSALATVLSLGLWIAGHGMLGLKLFGGAVLLLLVAVRLG
jgi:hypothetical protein